MKGMVLGLPQIIQMIKYPTFSENLKIKMKCKGSVILLIDIRHYTFTSGMQWDDI